MVEGMEEGKVRSMPCGHDGFTPAQEAQFMFERVDRAFAREIAAGGVDIMPLIQLGDIPEGPPCFSCGSPTVKAWMDHITRGGDGFEVRVDTPGYRCDTDGSGFFSDRGLLESLTRARIIFMKRGDGISDLLKPEIARLQSRIDL